MIQIRLILRMTAQLIALFNLSLALPLIISFVFQDQYYHVFFQAIAINFTIAILLYFPLRHYRGEFRNLDAYLLVTTCWVSIIVISAIPFLLSEFFQSPMDALFEATSGITTTGVEVIKDLSALPPSLLFYHQLLQFLGGLGIIILALAVMPMIGMGGLQVYQAEITGADKENKLQPRLIETAKSLWKIYLFLTVTCSVSYYLAGMDWFTAICESFGTVSTGGFSIQNTSFSYYNSYAIWSIASFFMLASSIGFHCHYAWQQKLSIKAYTQNIEAMTLVKLLTLFILIISLILWYQGHYDSWLESFMNSMFNLTSLFTTTGLTSSNFDQWPLMLPFVTLLVAIIGGCSGSTTGGIKISRLLFIFQEIKRTLIQLIHPQAIISIKLGQTIVQPEVCRQIRGFLFIFLWSLLTILILLLSTGMNFETAVAASISCLSCAGDSIAGVANGYSHLTSIQKSILILAMILGRIEILSFLVVFLPEFWRS